MQMRHDMSNMIILSHLVKYPYSNIRCTLQLQFTELGDFLHLQIPAKREVFVSNLDITLQCLALFKVSSGRYLTIAITFLKL